jgi:hypothetical protein
MRFLFIFVGLAVLLACKTNQISAATRVGKKAEAKEAISTKQDNNGVPKDAPAAQPRPAIRVGNPILNPYEYEIFVKHTTEEYKKFGTPKRAKRYKKKKYGNTLVEQRSGRKRLYDHNIFLRELFKGKLEAREYGDLREQFEHGIFLDIGSAILFGEGASTVRDLHEDTEISTKLTIIASDINDKSSKKTRYVDIYRKSPKKLPFPVVEVAMQMNKPEDFLTPLKLFIKEDTQGIILRSANAGPDLYYPPKLVREHLRSAIIAFADYNLIYFFNKFILYKPVDRQDFLIIGEIDDEVGTNHRQATWEDINWKKRRFNEAIRLNQQHVTRE